ncbi:UNVERIFIED_CONTAM: Cactin [Sesamum radiatum]|uniref:Cactin n=1 Tax=Sesamum radiatum TaxID=300843 RepID=A0AAW2R6E4_SESRA
MCCCYSGSPAAAHPNQARKVGSPTPTKTPVKSGRGMTSSSRNRRRYSSDDSSSDSASDNNRRMSRSRRTRRYSDSDSDEPSKRRSKRKITEDDIAEYLAKKAHKKAMKVAKKLKSQTVSGYSNDSNPFGDSNLNEKFVWRKKIERDVTQGVPLDEFSIKAEKKRQRERMAEIEKVKKRREERAIEKHNMRKRCKIRSEIRLREGRMKPIDILTKHLDPSDDFEIEINEPYMVFKGLTVKEMEELHNDIKMHLDLDRATPTHIRYWEALLVVCEWELAEARKKDALERARVRGEQLPQEMIGEERGLHVSIEADVKSLLQGKTFDELEALQSQIASQMQSGTAKVVEYWEAVLKRLHIYKAKACLKEIHVKMLRKHLERLERPSEGEKNRERTPGLDEQDSDQDAEGPILSPIPVMDAEVHPEEEPAGSYSPQLLHGDENEDAIDPEEDKAFW